MKQPVIALFCAGDYPDEERKKIRSGYIADGYKVKSLCDLNIPREKMHNMIKDAKHSDALVVGLMLYLASNVDFVVYVGKWYNDYIMVLARSMMVTLGVDVHCHDDD